MALTFFSATATSNSGNNRGGPRPQNPPVAGGTMTTNSTWRRGTARERSLCAFLMPAPNESMKSNRRHQYPVVGLGILRVRFELVLGGGRLFSRLVAKPNIC